MFISRSLRVSLAISLLSCSSIALAQPERQPAADGQADAEEVVEDENVIVVEGQRIHSEATELAADLAEYGTQVQLITDDEIKTGGFTNFGELAAGLIRGANIGYSPDEGEFTIRIDGATDRDTLLMVDGVPYFDRSSPSEDLWPATAIDPRMIASVEIFRGGQSLYFGSNGGLGVVSVRSKEPRRELGGEIGVYGGSFRTREIYGNVSVPLPLGDGAGEHSIMLFGRSYETDSNILFDRKAFADTLLELGGFREYPYSYNNLGARYRWIINPDTEFGAGFQLATIDFEDTFPNSTPYAPNKTEFPIFNASFRSELTDRMRLEVEGHYQAPSLLNTELDPLAAPDPARPGSAEQPPRPGACARIRDRSRIRGLRRRQRHSCWLRDQSAVQFRARQRPRPRRHLCQSRQREALWHARQPLPDRKPDGLRHLVGRRLRHRGAGQRHRRRRSVSIRLCRLWEPMRASTIAGPIGWRRCSARRTPAIGTIPTPFSASAT